jgi:Bacterial regulatory proteins, gntR family
VVADATVELFRWIRDGKSTEGDPLPSLRTLARRFGVGTNAVREAVQGLATLGLVKTQMRYQSRAAAPGLVLRVDALPLWIRAADTREQRAHGVQAWLELKWLVAEAALGALIRFGSPSNIDEIDRAFTNLILSARPGGSPFEIADDEVFIYWRAAYLMDRPGLHALASSLVSATHEWTSLWEVLVDPEAFRDKALALRIPVVERDQAGMQELVRRIHEHEWSSWKKKLERMPSPRPPPRPTAQQLLGVEYNGGLEPPAADP